MDLEQTFHKLMESRGAGLDDENLEEKLGDAVVFKACRNTLCASNALC